MIVRPATEHDLPRINEIYNSYVAESPATFDIEPITLVERREWFTHYGTTGPHRLLVAEEDVSVIGYATSSPFRARAAYATSIETSVYCDPAFSGRGVGTALYADLFKTIDGEDLHRAYAGISLPNDASVALHTRFGFERVGVYSEVGRKFDKYWDVAWYEKRL